MSAGILRWAPGTHSITHVLVGQQDDGQIDRDRLPLLRPLQIRAAGKGFRFDARLIPTAQELLQFAGLLWHSTFFGLTTIAWVGQRALCAAPIRRSGRRRPSSCRI
jgi:hypothetical protein